MGTIGHTCPCERRQVIPPSNHAPRQSVYPLCPMLSQIGVLESFLEIVERCVAASPVASLVQLEENGGTNLFVCEHEFTYDTLKG